jgi:hypothetical protein
VPRPRLEFTPAGSGRLGILTLVLSSAIQNEYLPSFQTDYPIWIAVLREPPRGGRMVLRRNGIETGISDEELSAVNPAAHL